MKSLAEAIRSLTAYKAGQRWAVWADEHRQVQMCRDDGSHWATPIGHITESEMRSRGWIKADGTEG